MDRRSAVLIPIDTGYDTPCLVSTRCVDLGRYMGHREAYYAAHSFTEGTEGIWHQLLPICHHCDVPACRNSDHLYLGTSKQNARDRQIRGRRDPNLVFFGGVYLPADRVNKHVTRAPRKERP